jgi:hypothetical protein
MRTRFFVVFAKGGMPPMMFCTSCGDMFQPSTPPQDMRVWFQAFEKPAAGSTQQAVFGIEVLQQSRQPHFAARCRLPAGR